MRSARITVWVCCALTFAVTVGAPFVGHAQQLTLVETQFLWVGGASQLPSEFHPGETGDMGTSGAWWKYQCHFEGCTYHGVTLHVTWQVPQQIIAGQEIVIEAQAWGDLDSQGDKYIFAETADACFVGAAIPDCVGVSAGVTPDDPSELALKRETLRKPFPGLDPEGKLHIEMHVTAGPLDARIHYFYQGESPVGQAPRITSLDWPPQVVVGTLGTLSLDFEDPDGDVSWITVEKRISGSWTFAGESSAGVTGQTQGRINSSLSCPPDQVGQVQARVILTDAAGRSSTPWEFSFECVSGETPPPPPPSGQDQVLADGQPVQPGDTIRVPRGGKVEISAKCAEALRYFALFAATWNEELKSLFGMGKIPEFAAMVIAIGKICSEPQSPAWLPAAVEHAFIELKVLQGPGRFTVLHDALALGIHTDTAVVRSKGLNDFSVGYDPATERSIVAVHSGAVDVEPTNSNLPSIVLGAGQQVEVAEAAVGPITPIGPQDGSTTIAQALDANRNNVLDDAEIRQAVQYWILGQTVPGTNEIIDDAKIRQLIQMWILGTVIES